MITALPDFVTEHHDRFGTRPIVFLAEVPAEDTAAYAPRASEAQKLMSPAEMGELFKVIAFGRGVDVPLLGFARGDRTHKL